MYFNSLYQINENSLESDEVHFHVFQKYNIP
jgi:hypothetical protein